MNVQDYLSDDGQVMLALCSAFGFRESTGDTEPPPLKLSEWNQLARQIESSSFKTPASLQGRAMEDLAKELALSPGEAERLAALLERSGRLALELENLFSRGMWAVTRADEFYPPRLRESLKHQAPAILRHNG